MLLDHVNLKKNKDVFKLLQRSTFNDYGKKKHYISIGFMPVISCIYLLFIFPVKALAQELYLKYSLETFHPL